MNSHSVHLAVRWVGVSSREHVHCAEKDVDVDVTFGRKARPNWTPGERVDVVRCSAFEDSNHVTCDENCLHDPAVIAA